MSDIFQEAGLPLWLLPYEVLCTSSYTALIETVPDTVSSLFLFCRFNDKKGQQYCADWALFTTLQASLHAIKTRYPNITSLRDFFVAKYHENSPSFKLAQVLFDFSFGRKRYSFGFKAIVSLFPFLAFPKIIIWQVFQRSA